MRPRPDAIGRIEVSTGVAGWPQAASLLGAVWPPEIVATLPWRNVVWADADYRVLICDLDDNATHVPSKLAASAVLPGARAVAARKSPALRCSARRTNCATSI